MKTPLSTSHPYLTEEWADEKKIESFSKGSQFKAKWQCKNNHKYYMMIQNKAKGQNCPYCSGKKILLGKNDLASTHPDLLKEWSPGNSKNPQNVSAGSHFKAEWVCLQNSKHLWETSIAHRALDKTGCPYCAGRKILPGDNDLATKYPKIMQEWSPENSLSPYKISPGINKKVEWICLDFQHKYTMSITDKVHKKAGCPICSGKKVVPGINDLATIYPEIAIEMNDNKYKSTELTATSGRKVEWLCPNKHKYYKIVANRTKQGQGCPYCSGRKVQRDFNDIATTYPHLKKYWNDKTRKINTVSSGSGFIAQWKCEENHSFKRAIHDMVSSFACPVCSGKLIIPGINDLKTLYPEISKEWSGNNPLKASEVSPGSQNIYEWKCSEDHYWKTVPNNRTRFNHGCPDCWKKSTRSKAEKELSNYIEEKLGFSVKNDRKILNGKELDIYIPKKNFAIEYNGNYWHSEEMGKHQWYHYEKWKQCKQSNIHLFSIWEDDYLEKPELIKSMIAYKLGVHTKEKIAARKTVFKKVSNKEAQLFYEENHLQGNHQRSQHYALKSKESGDIVAMMSVRLTKSKNRLEVSRFATNSNVQGGFSKLLKNILKDSKYEEVKTILSYSHNDHSWGNLYRKNGFTLISEGTPGYFYFKKGDRKVKRMHRLNYSPKRFKERSDLIFVEGKKERELAVINDLVRIWDCGSSRWEKQI